LLNIGDAVGLISCSDGLYPDEKKKLRKIIRTLDGIGLDIRVARTIYRTEEAPFSGTPEARAKELMKLFRDPSVEVIFDVSGGDSANQILPFLDYDVIRKSGTLFTGISDLSVINNAIFAQCGLPACHYRIKNLAGSCATDQKAVFLNYFSHPSARTTFNCRWLRGHKMSGTVVGGNIRCFLKLAGTVYFPDTWHRILFLESLGGGPARMASLLAQLDQLGVFSRVSGVLLGTFTEMQSRNRTPAIDQLVLAVTEKYQLPVAKTNQLGHGEDAVPLPIGLPLTLTDPGFVS
jgi:muramoyltetrapeptide carboxypeptidase LdcA involved in peptidoglycan recycling